MAQGIKCKYEFRWGLIVFILSFFVSIGCLATLAYVSREHGTPHSSECLEAFNNARLLSTLILVLAPTGFFLLLFQLAGKLISMLYWFLLAFSFGVCLIAFVKALVWICMSEETRINDMLKLSENTYQNFKKYTLHSSNIEIKNECCGVVNFTDYPEQIFGQFSPEHARVPDRCCAKTLKYKDCGRALVYNYTYKYGRPRLENETMVVKIDHTVCNNAKFTHDLTQKQFTDYAYAFNQSIVKNKKMDPAIQKLESKVKELMCKDERHNDIYCAIETTKGYIVGAHRWEWCFQLFYNTTSSSADLNYEVIRMRGDKHIMPNGCFSHLEPYVDMIAKIVFGFASVLLGLISTMLPFYLHMYWHYREKQLRPYPLPYWFDPLPGEKDLPVGLGMPSSPNDPLTHLDDRELEVALRAQVEADDKHPEPEIHLEPLHDTMYKKRPHRKHQPHTSHQQQEALTNKRPSADAGTETASRMVSDSLGIPPSGPRPKEE